VQHNNLLVLNTDQLLLPPPLFLPAVGSIIGFALAFGGTGAVQWARPDPRSFPPYRGIVPIVLSWIVSPVLTGSVAAGVFALTRWLVLRRERAAKLAFWVLPPAVLVTVMINVFFVCECQTRSCSACACMKRLPA
jgi:phosphate/sulfate permease